MNTSVTLSAAAFTEIHNALCFAESKGLEATVETIRRALSDAYRQEEQDFDQKFRHYGSIKDQMGFSTVWSMYEISDLSQRHPYFSDAFVCYQGGHVPVFGSTWTDIYRAADQAIRNSGDLHHIFIEGFEVRNGNELHLITGS